MDGKKDMIIGGVDPAFESDFFTIALIERQEGTPKSRLIHLDAWHRNDWIVIKDELVKKRDKFKVFKWFVDMTRDTALVTEMKHSHLRTEGIIFSAMNKHMMVSQLARAIALGEFVIPHPESTKFNLQTSPKQKRLLEDFNIQAKHQQAKRDSANPKYAHPEGEHDDLFWAVAIAYSGMQTLPNYPLSHAFIRP